MCSLQNALAGEVQYYAEVISTNHLRSISNPITTQIDTPKHHPLVCGSHTHLLSQPCFPPFWQAPIFLGQLEGAHIQPDACVLESAQLPPPLSPRGINYFRVSAMHLRGPISSFSSVKKIIKLSSNLSVISIILRIYTEEEAIVLVGQCQCLFRGQERFVH